ncbi:MAG: DUF2799 domain-containing protein [Pseudomonadota bacterium]
MKRRLRLSLTIVGGALGFGVLAACATLSKEECAVVNWSDLGQRDGEAGYHPSRVERHAKACARADIAVDTQAYLAAHAMGIRQYCTAANGLSVGSRGERYRNSCPAELEAAFLRPYNAASEVRSAEFQVDNARARIESVTDQAFSVDLTPEQRLSLQNDLDDARADLKDAEFDLRRARLKLQRITREIL